MIVEKAQIEQTLRPLVGLPLSDMGRFAGWQRFEFGPQKPFINTKEQEATKADYAIDVSCGWRIVGPEGIVVGSDDYGPGAVTARRRVGQSRCCGERSLRPDGRLLAGHPTDGGQPGRSVDFPASWGGSIHAGRAGIWVVN